MPPLRERCADIPGAREVFIDRYAKDNGKTIEGCAPVTIELLMSHGCPSNVREPTGCRV